MDKIEGTNVLRRYNNKKIERVIKSSAFFIKCCDLAIFLYLAHSWPGLNRLCKAKYKMNKYIATTSSYFKRFVFRVYFIRLGYYIHLSKIPWK